MKMLNALEAAAFPEMEKKFTRVMSVIRKSLGDKAFAKYRLNEDGEWKEMSSFNAAVYDALAVSIADKLAPDATELPTDFQDHFRNLFKDAEFFGSVEGSVNDKNKVETRITSAKKLLD
jgi:hypothetical protein